jgi:hypothetical protein
MKVQQYLPLLAAAIGFSVAWVIKTGPAPVAAPAGAAEKSGPKKSARSETKGPRPNSMAERRPAEVKPGDFPLTSAAAQAPKNREEAKMVRLTEALGLSAEQQAEITKAMEEAKAGADKNLPIIEDLTIRGRKVEECLKNLLSAEQLAKFDEMRVRERENRIETRCQMALMQVIREIDLSPGQRDEALSRLRQAEKARVQSIPSAAALLLKTSVLPTVSESMTVDSLISIAQLAESPPGSDPAANTRQMLAIKRQNLEDKLRCFDGLFTPGQMNQYYAVLGDERALIERMESQSGK